MDRREKIDSSRVALNTALDGRQAKIWTAMPGILKAYDATKFTASVQIAVQAQMRDPYGKWNDTTISLLVDCPVSFPRGGGYGLSFPLVDGDEGLVVFASRCIDAWWQSGGVQPQAEFRMHDLSDGFFVPGACSKPKVPANASTNSARLWAEDGSMFADLNKSSGQFHIKAPTIILEGAVVVEGTVSGQVGGGGTIDFGTATVKQGGKDIGAGHAHTGVKSGTDISGPVS